MAAELARTAYGRDPDADVSLRVDADDVAETVDALLRADAF